jgi:hypothetical protein
MSETKSAAIRKFKDAFKVHQEDWYFTNGTKVALDNLMKAQEVLKIKTESATASLKNLMSVGDNAKRKMTKELQTTWSKLDSDNAIFLRAAKAQKSNSAQKDVDAVTTDIGTQIDAWVKFEDDCVASRNMMKSYPDDNVLLQKLIERTNGLSEQAVALVEKQEKAVAPIISGLSSTSRTLLQGEDSDRDLSQIIKRLEEFQGQLMKLSLEASKSDVELGGKALKNIFGITLDIGKGGDKDTVPYQQLLAAFSMAPPDHARNLALSRVEIKEVKDGESTFSGGMYYSDKKTIAITPDIRGDVLEEYKNPDTGKLEKVNSFTITTLHEIGHSVDEAYSIMKNNGANAGCGGWSEVDPFAYVKDDFDAKKKDLSTSLMSFLKVHLPAIEASVLPEADLRKAWVGYAAGVPVDDAFKAPLESVIARWEHENVAQLEEAKSDLKSPTIRAAVDICLKAKAGDKVAELWAELDKVVDPRFKALAKFNASTITVEDIRKQFFALFKDQEEVPAEKVETTEFQIWMSLHPDLMADAKAHEKFTNIKEAAAKWSAAATTKPPAPVDLKKFGARQKPWNTLDLSKEAKINGYDASQQSYEAGEKWVRYTNRAASFVTNYQWRAPGEWFAELYAISWYSKAEPPSGVPGAVRAYCYGGSVPA